MTERILCKLCGTEFESDAACCPGCRTEVDILGREVHLPFARGAVNDFPGLLSDAQAGELSSMAGSFFRQTEVPIVIAIVDDTEPLTPAEYAFLLYNHWGIGKAGINRGVLILLCMKEQHLESEIGLGLEEILPEEVGDEIVRTAFLPHFREGSFFEGLKAGTRAMMDALRERLPTVG